MRFKTLEESLLFLEKNKQLVRVTEEVSPHLEMAAIHLRMYAAGGPAILFEKITGCKYRCASNIFGSLQRSKLLFGKNLNTVGQLIHLKNDPLSALKKPLQLPALLAKGLTALPRKVSFQSASFTEITIADLPQIQHWPMDGGSFVTLPQVYSEDVDAPGVQHSNMGMYRIQLAGNDYIFNEEIGLHYQLHRGIGVHQTKANKINKPLKVSVFVGGPPANSVAAVMPLPEGMSELQFAGILGGRRFKYTYADGYCLSADADFVITGEVAPMENKPEGPFGDHLGYYSLLHPFPVMKVHKVYAKKNAIWPFTVVGRPPQEDTSFGELIHEMTGDAIQAEIPGLLEVNAVDAAGVHPLLLTIGSERYTPYQKVAAPSELLTIANRVLGTGQLSLAKFLFITATQGEQLSAKNIPDYFRFILERIDLRRDLHFYTNTSIDTLDYSGTGINRGSKVVIAAYGEKLRELGARLPGNIAEINGITDVKLVLPGILALSIKNFTDYNNAAQEIRDISAQLSALSANLAAYPLIILCDDACFVAEQLNNFLWVSFTRCNPANDIYGVDSFTQNKHWGCNGPLLLDARVKPHHAPPLIIDAVTEAAIAPIFEKGGSLYGY